MMRSERLAAQLAEVNDELILLLEGLSEEQWQLRVADEERPVGIVALHVARAHPRINERVVALAAGAPVTARRPDLFAERNRREAEAHPSPNRLETIALLRRNGEAARLVIAQLSDSDLDRPGEEELGVPTTAATVIEQRQIGHVRSHLASISQTVLP